MFEEISLRLAVAASCCIVGISRGASKEGCNSQDIPSFTVNDKLHIGGFKCTFKKKYIRAERALLQLVHCVHPLEGSTPSPSIRLRQDKNGADTECVAMEELCLDTHTASRGHRVEKNSRFQQI